MKRKLKFSKEFDKAADKIFVNKSKKPKFVDFVNIKNNKTLASISIKGIFPGKITATRKLLAQEQGIEFKDVVGKLKIRKTRK